MYRLLSDNKQEYETLRTWRGSHYWLRIKKLYNAGGPGVRLALETWYKGKDIVKMLIRLKNPMTEVQRYSSSRGMSWSVDTSDWLGGLPYEFAGVDEIFNFCPQGTGTRTSESQVNHLPWLQSVSLF